jgi:hypothetical protein
MDAPPTATYAGLAQSLRLAGDDPAAKKAWLHENADAVMALAPEGRRAIGPDIAVHPLACQDTQYCDRSNGVIADLDCISRGCWGGCRCSGSAPADSRCCD